MLYAIPIDSVCPTGLGFRQTMMQAMRSSLANLCGNPPLLLDSNHVYRGPSMISPVGLVMSDSEPLRPETISTSLPCSDEILRIERRRDLYRRS